MASAARPTYHLGMRIGHGFDAHRLAPGRDLILGGVTIPHDRGLHGHSDADVLTHAIIDALLGAAGLGDIGGKFPSSDPAWEGASSLDLLRRAYAEVRGEGLAVSNIDATIVAEAPKLAPHVSAMRDALSRLLEVDPKQVNIKATTTDGMGFTGRGEGIAAFAIVLLE